MKLTPFSVALLLSFFAFSKMNTVGPEPCTRQPVNVTSGVAAGVAGVCIAGAAGGAGGGVVCCAERTAAPVAMANVTASALTTFFMTLSFCWEAVRQICHQVVYHPQIRPDLTSRGPGMAGLATR